MVREIMTVDCCDWSTARNKLSEMNEYNDHFRALITLPYKIGLTAGFVAAISSIPLVFHRDTALWFNEKFVHEV